MAIIIFCGDKKRHEKIGSLLEMLEGYPTQVCESSYRDIRSKIQKHIHCINILNYNYLKSERYELYLVAKRYGVPYCVINFPEEDPEGASEKNRYDNPYVEGDMIEKVWLEKVLGGELKESIVHKKTVFSSDYLSNVKRIIEKVNTKHGNLFFFCELEKRMIKLLQTSPETLCDVEKSYEKLVVDEIRARE